MTLDPLYMMLMIEAILLLSLVAGLLGFILFKVRSKKSHSNNDFGRDQLINLLEDNVLEVKEKLKTFADTNEDNISKLIEKSVFEMNSDFIIGFRDSLKNEEDSPLDLIAEAVTTIYRDAASKKLQWVEGLQEKTVLVAAESDVEEDKAEEKVDLETTQIIETVDTSEAIKKMKDKFVVYQGYNKDSKKQLAKLQKDKAKAEGYAELLAKNIEQSETFIKELELGNRDLQTCVDTLQQSNEELLEKTRKFQKVVEAATKETKRSKDKLGEKEKEVEELKKQLEKAKADGFVVDVEASGPAEESENNGGEAINQDDIDSLLNGSDNAGDDEAPAEEVVSQDDIDSLLNGSDSAGGAAQAEEVVSQDDIDSLLNGSDSAGGAAQAEEVVSQDDIDALLNGGGSDSGQAKDVDLLSQEDVQKMLEETGADTGTLKGSDDSGSDSDTNEIDLQATKDMLEAAEDEYMVVYNELSPLHEAALAGQAEATTPEAQQKIKDLEEKLAAKEKSVQVLEEQLAEQKKAAESLVDSPTSGDLADNNEPEAKIQDNKNSGQGLLDEGELQKLLEEAETDSGEKLDNEESF